MSHYENISPAFSAGAPYRGVNTDNKTDNKTYCAESNDGNIEYKYKLVNLDEETKAKRITQMKYRINEGNGEAFYYIGIMDNGTPKGIIESEYKESQSNLNYLALKLDCSITKIYESIIKDLYIGEFLIREINKNHYVDVKICVAGNVDAGKSTMIGTLTRGCLDDGRGKSRLHVFNFKHEIDSGRTSSIGHQIMGFDSKGDIVNTKYDRMPSWSEIVSNSNKIISFFDLAGHEKYLRTTIYGLTLICPDYCLIMVGANMGINHMTKEHIGLCLTLNIPFIIIVSKIDIVPLNVLEDNMKKIYNICKKGAKKIPYNIKTNNDVVSAVKKIKSDSIVPIIQISNVTGYNLDLLKFMLNILPVRNDYSDFINQPIEFLIDNTYSVTGHVTIVSGLLRSGTLKINDNLALGPFSDGSYKQCKVRTIHCKLNDIKEAIAGKYICISLKNIHRREIKKGMVLVSDIYNCKIAQKEFWANIHILHSPTTIKIGYQPFLHINQVRQCVKITEIIKIIKDTDYDSNQFKTNLNSFYSESNIFISTPKTNINDLNISSKKYTLSNSSSIGEIKKFKSLNDRKLSNLSEIQNHSKSLNDIKLSNLSEIQNHSKTLDDRKLSEKLEIIDDKILRTGDRAYIKLEFIGKPEYIKPMMKLIFREGKVRAVGKVI